MLTCVVPALAQTVTAAALGGLSSPRESPHSAERVAVWELGRERLALQEEAFPAGWTHFCVFLLLPADPLEEVAANPPQTAANSAAELLKQGAGQARCRVRTPVTGGSPRPHRHPGFPSFRAATRPRHTRAGRVATAGRECPRDASKRGRGGGHGEPVLGLGAVGGQDVGGLPSSRCCARSDAARSADEQWCDPRCPQPRPAQSTQQALRGASVFLSNVYCFRGILALQPNRGERAGSSRTPRRRPPVSPTARTPGWHVRDARGTCTASSSPRAHSLCQVFSWLDTLWVWTNDV